MGSILVFRTLTFVAFFALVRAGNALPLAEHPMPEGRRW
jgi:hypothetical protein